MSIEIHITETSPYKSYPRFAPNNSKNGGNLGLVLKDKKWIFLHKIICCCDLLESPRASDSNRLPQHMISRRNYDNYEKKNLLESGLL